MPADTATRDYGVGTSLVGAWGFTPAEQAAQQDDVPLRFAYLVIPRGSENVGSLSIIANVASSTKPTGYTFTRSSWQELPRILPEPATMTLIGLSLAGLGFIRRR